MITQIIAGLNAAFSQVAGIVSGFLGYTEGANGLFDAINDLSSKVF